jgi:hypothetical protein
VSTESRRRRIAKYGRRAVIDAELDYQRRYRARKAENAVKPVTFEASLKLEGYTWNDAQKAGAWVRGGWKCGPLPQRLCHCHDGILCSVHWLDTLRAVM